MSCQCCKFKIALESQCSHSFATRKLKVLFNSSLLCMLNQLPNCALVSVPRLLHSNCAVTVLSLMLFSFAIASTVAPGGFLSFQYWIPPLYGFQVSRSRTPMRPFPQPVASMGIVLAILSAWHARFLCYGLKIVSALINLAICLIHSKIGMEGLLHMLSIRLLLSSHLHFNKRDQWLKES